MNEVFGTPWEKRIEHRMWYGATHAWIVIPKDILSIPYIAVMSPLNSSPSSPIRKISVDKLFEWPVDVFRGDDNKLYYEPGNRKSFDMAFVALVRSKVLSNKER